MTKRELVEYFGTAAAAAKVLGITRAAISQWPDEEPIPEKQELRLKYELRPEMFNRRQKT